GRNGNAKTGRVTEVGSQIATCRGGAPVSRTDENSRIGCYDRKARRGVLLGHDVSHRFGVGVAVLSRYVSGPRLAQLSKLTLHTHLSDAVGHNDALAPRSPCCSERCLGSVDRIRQDLTALLLVERVSRCRVIHSVTTTQRC